jgi:putative transcriptional regulator
MQLASNLSLLMGKHRYSIQDVHEKTGLARRTISALYNDKATRIDFSTIEKLCQLFDCGINQLFILCDDKKQPLHIAVKENMQ